MTKMLISETQIKQYRKDGAICIKQAVSSNEVNNLLQQIDHLIESEDDRWTTIREGGFSDRYLWPTHPWMYDFCSKSNLPAIAGQLMQSSSARLFFDHIFFRDAGTRQKTPWHQDRTYWPFQGLQIASVWVALETCTLQSGVLSFIAGSHNWGISYIPSAFSKKSGSAEFLKSDLPYTEQMPGFDAEPEKYPVLRWNMEPGDVLVFGGETIHGAAENNDMSKRRAAMSVRYVGDDARWDPRPGTDPITNQDNVSVQPGEAPHDEERFPLVWSAPQ
jgi:ectoine hydroxylase-related dioxygenase (phytanoyl-CoA dioxygenase family)